MKKEGKDFFNAEMWRKENIVMQSGRKKGTHLLFRGRERGERGSPKFMRKPRPASKHL